MVIALGLMKSNKIREMAVSQGLLRKRAVHANILILKQIWNIGRAAKLSSFFMKKVPSWSQAVTACQQVACRFGINLVDLRTAAHGLVLADTGLTNEADHRFK